MNNAATVQLAKSSLWIRLAGWRLWHTATARWTGRASIRRHADSDRAAQSHARNRAW